jgi:hypothetical protein
VTRRLDLKDLFLGSRFVMATSVRKLKASSGNVSPSAISVLQLGSHNKSNSLWWRDNFTEAAIEHLSVQGSSSCQRRFQVYSKLNQLAVVGRSPNCKFELEWFDSQSTSGLNSRASSRGKILTKRIIVTPEFSLRRSDTAIGSKGSISRVQICCPGSGSGAPRLPSLQSTSYVRHGRNLNPKRDLHAGPSVRALFEYDLPNDLSSKGVIVPISVPRLCIGFCHRAVTSSFVQSDETMMIGGPSRLSSFLRDRRRLRTSPEECTRASVTNGVVKVAEVNRVTPLVTFGNRCRDDGTHSYPTTFKANPEPDHTSMIVSAELPTSRVRSNPDYDIQQELSIFIVKLVKVVNSNLLKHVRTNSLVWHSSICSDTLKAGHIPQLGWVRCVSAASLSTHFGGTRPHVYTCSKPDCRTVPSLVRISNDYFSSLSVGKSDSYEHYRRRQICKLGYYLRPSLVLGEILYTIPFQCSVSDPYLIRDRAESYSRLVWQKMWIRNLKSRSLVTSLLLGGNRLVCQHTLHL